MNPAQYTILKIERPKYEVVEEKKALLTKEEKEFLKDMCKYYNDINIIFYDRDIRILNKDNRVVNYPDYPDNLKFKNVKRGINYTLKELGLEEK